MAVLAIESDDGLKGFCFGSPQALRPYLVENYIKKVFVGEDPLRFEKLWQSLARWQRGSGGQLSDKTIAIAEMALLDLVGKKLLIGNVEVQGHDLCRPCKHLEETLKGQDIIKEFLRRGGLRCEVLNSGTVIIGDEIKVI